MPLSRTSAEDHGPSRPRDAGQAPASAPGHRARASRTASIDLDADTKSVQGRGVSPAMRS
jgi:hypothetical protein